jgi:hypothetical protein
MPVRLPTPPIESLTALGDALNAGGVSTRSYLAMADATERWVPHHVYTAFVQDLAIGRPVAECARETGWQYLLPQSFGTVVSADVQIGPDGRHTIAHFAQGLQSEQTLRLTQQVINDPRLATDDYSLELLLVPGLYVLALWLRQTDASRDWFVPAVPGDARLPFGEYIEAARFDDVMRSMAIERMGQGTPEA